MTEICMDNRFEIIEAAKRDIIAATNIETSKDEMKVLDSILFRAWQMGWLDKKYDKHKQMTNADRIRAMSDEELAVWLKVNLDCAFCPVGISCMEGKSCHKLLFEWLRQPAEV